MTAVAHVERGPAEEGRRPAPVVAVDAEGGDNAPAAIVEGVLVAASEGIRVILTGREAVLRELVAGRPGASSVEFVDAPEIIGFSEEPARAVRDHPQSSLVVAARLVAQGRAQAVFSAGNSGALLAAALLTIKRMRGIQRPAIAVVLPAVPSPVVLLDAGANAEVRPAHLLQFALMGQAFAREVLGVRRPSVGLLSIGEEANKGTPLVVEAHALLRDDPRVDFLGNVEGRDLLVHRADVVVTDGFTGNVALKTSEGAGKALITMLRDSALSSVRARAGGLLLKPALRGMRAALDPEMYGGAHLLGMARLAPGRSRRPAALSGLPDSGTVPANPARRSTHDARRYLHLDQGHPGRDPGCRGGQDHP